MKKKDQEYYPISPMSETINMMKNGDKRPQDEILREVEARRKATHVFSDQKSGIVTRESLVLIDPDIRHHFTPEELADFNR